MASTVDKEILPSSNKAMLPVAPISAEDVLAAALAGKVITTSTPANIIPVTAAATAATSTRPAEKASSTGAVGLDWLSAAAVGEKQGGKNLSSASARRPSLGSTKTSPPPPPAAAGGWLASGKLGISTDDDGGEGGGLGPSVTATGSVGKSKASRKTEKGEPKRKTSSPSKGAAVVPGGWLAAAISTGKLGVEDGEDEGEQSNDAEGGPKMVTSSTQWEEGDGEEKANTPITTLPPWAKKWTPPAPDPTPVEAEDKIQDQPAAEAANKPAASGLDWINGALLGPSVETTRGTIYIVRQYSILRMNS